MSHRQTVRSLILLCPTQLTFTRGTGT